MTDTTHEDDAAASAPPPSKKGRTIPKRGKAAAKPKRDPYTDQDLLFSEKSKLVGVDLVVCLVPFTAALHLTSQSDHLTDHSLAQKLFANPLAWDLLDDTEKQELRDLLPTKTPYDAEGRPAAEFLRYNNAWRNGVRLFQEDVAEGRYEREWLEQAEQAHRERREGQFDAWKAREFEAFWGQKAHVDPARWAREMGKIPLESLVRDGEVKVGDVWEYAKTLGRGRGKFLLEKEVTILEVLEGTMLRVVIPPGQRKKLLLPPTTTPTAPSDASAGTNKIDSNAPSGSSNAVNGNALQQTSNDVNGNASNQTSNGSHTQQFGDVKVTASGEPLAFPSRTYQNDAATAAISGNMLEVPSPANSSELSEPTSISPPSVDLLANSSAAAPAEPPTTEPPNESMDIDSTTTPTGQEPKAVTNDRSSSVPQEASEAIAIDKAVTTTEGRGRRSKRVVFAAGPTEKIAELKSKGEHSDTSAHLADEGEEPVEYVVDSLPTLEHAIIEVDGRARNFDGKGGGQWRTFRCIRDGKDRGSLWDMKERYGERKGLLSMGMH